MYKWGPPPRSSWAQPQVGRQLFDLRPASELADLRLRGSGASRAWKMGCTILHQWIGENKTYELPHWSLFVLFVSCLNCFFAIRLDFKKLIIFLPKKQAFTGSFFVWPRCMGGFTKFNQIKLRLVGRHHSKWISLLVLFCSVLRFFWWEREIYIFIDKFFVGKRFLKFVHCLFMLDK